MNIEPGFASARHDQFEMTGVDDGPARNRRWIIIGVAAALLIGLVVLMLHGGGKQAAKAPSLPRVSVIVPDRQSITSTINATGTLAARREMPVGVVGEGGMVARVVVEPGDWVEAGSTLAVIERSVQVEQANSLAASIDVARADAALAQSELERAQALVGRGFISKADLERRIASRDSARARVNVAQAQYDEMRARIGRLDIRAPSAGLVLTRSVEPGQVVGAGGSTLFRLAKDGEMELNARLSEQDLARLHIGASAQVTPVGSPRSFHGSVWQLSPVIDPQTRQGVARIRLGYDPAIRPGGFASAAIASGTVNAPLLPESAVQSDDKGNFVYIVGAGDTVQRRDVKVGDVSDKGITVLSGLNGGEQVVLSAGAFLHPGDKIVPERRRAPVTTR